MPAIAHAMPTWTRRLHEARREAPDPAIDRGVVDLDASLRQELLDVSVGEAEAEIPPQGQCDDLGREAEAGEARVGQSGRTRSVEAHSRVSSRAPDPAMQQCRQNLSARLGEAHCVCSRKVFAWRLRLANVNRERRRSLTCIGVRELTDG
jgi:hypothetical protein